MVYVVLRNGKVLQYNDTTRVFTEPGCFSLQTDDSHLVAKVPMDIVERVEWEPPCAILRAKAKPKASKSTRYGG